MAIRGAPSRARRAAHLDELADALDAGLDPTTALAGLGIPAHPDRGVAAALAATQPPLAPAVRATLEAAEAGGRLPQALRRAAAAMRRSDARRRDLIARLAYPLTLATFALGVGALSATVLGDPGMVGPAVIGLAVFAIVAVASWTIGRRTRRDPGFPVERLPVVGALCADLAAADWLETMTMAVASGIALPPAHALATRAVDGARERARLTAAQSRLDAGEQLATALREARALDEETVDAIGRAEHTGTLEEAFDRLGAYRRDRATRRAAALVRAIGTGAYVVAAIVVAATVFRFYGGMLDVLPGR